MKVQHGKYTFILCTHSYFARECRFCLRKSLNKRISGAKLRNTKEAGRNKLP